ncbi:hypothetical protein J6590_085141 [Homalodisca vitripennis]|nr:hypothetical protein J6590_085141 [Homalodisca vitripennis]
MREKRMFLSEAPYWSKPPRHGHWTSQRSLSINVISDASEARSLVFVVGVLFCGLVVGLTSQRSLSINVISDGKSVKCSCRKRPTGRSLRGTVTGPPRDIYPSTSSVTPPRHGHWTSQRSLSINVISDGKSVKCSCRKRPTGRSLLGTVTGPPRDLYPSTSSVTPPRHGHLTSQRSLSINVISDGKSVECSCRKRLTGRSLRGTVTGPPRDLYPSTSSVTPPRHGHWTSQRSLSINVISDGKSVKCSCRKRPTGRSLRGTVTGPPRDIYPSTSSVTPPRHGHWTSQRSLSINVISDGKSVECSCRKRLTGRSLRGTVTGPPRDLYPSTSSVTSPRHGHWTSQRYLSINVISDGKSVKCSCRKRPTGRSLLGTVTGPPRDLYPSTSSVTVSQSNVPVESALLVEASKR